MCVKFAICTGLVCEVQPKFSHSERKPVLSSAMYIAWIMMILFIVQSVDNILGKGHEKEDLDVVLKKLEHWAYRLYPKFKFEDCLKKIETLGKKRAVMVCMYITVKWGHLCDAYLMMNLFFGPSH